MTPTRPPGPITGTDHELATLADRARSLNGAQAAPTRTLSTTGCSVAAATPTGPPPGPNDSRDHAPSSASGRPSDAAQTSASPDSRWMHSRSLPSAAPSADRISDRLDEGSAETSRSARPCRRVSWRRADESTCWPATSVTTSSGWTWSGTTSPTTRPCRSTTIRSASRNIWSMSWQASTIVVPRSRSRAISPSTWADSATPSAAVGSSSNSSRGLRDIALATATSWRWPPDSELTARVVSVSGIWCSASIEAAAAWKRVSDSRWARRSWPSSRLEATSRLSHSARSCQTTATPWRDTASGSWLTGLPSSAISPLVGLMSPAMQRTSVVLPAPFSPARATSSPGRTARSTPSSARSGP